MKRKPFEPSRPMSQEEWRVMTRDLAWFLFGSLVICAVLAFLLGLMIGKI